MKSDKHNKLQDTAIGWLYARGCGIFAKEVPTKNGIADALGIVTRRRYGGADTVYYIEAKVSRSDLLCLKQKCVYRRSIDALRPPEYCPLHIFKTERDKAKDCDQCRVENDLYNNGIDFYYFIVADGIVLEPDLYPEWGVINEAGKVVRKAKRIPKKKESNEANNLAVEIAHVLVYKVFGKMYAPAEE